MDQNVYMDQGKYEKLTNILLRNIYEEKQFCDVSLVSNDGQTVKGHQVILAARSKTFENMFRGNKNPNLLIYLKDTSITILNFIMDFIYFGSISVPKTHMREFLHIGSSLQIDGLLAAGETKTKGFREDIPTEFNVVVKPDYDFNEIKSAENVSENRVPDIVLNKATNSIANTSECEIIQPNMTSQKENFNDINSSVRKISSKPNNNKSKLINSDNSQNLPTQSIIFQDKKRPRNKVVSVQRTMMLQTGLQCSHCSITATNTQYLKYHIESTHEFKFKCQYCGYEYKMLPALQAHTKERNNISVHVM